MLKINSVRSLEMISPTNSHKQTKHAPIIYIADSPKPWAMAQGNHVLDNFKMFHQVWHELVALY